MANWSFVSSSGRIRVKLTAPPAADGLQAMLCSLTIESDFWQRDREFTKGALIRDFDVSLHQVLIDPAEFGSLHDKLDGWLATGAEFECKLGTLSPGDPGLIFSIGKSADLIYTPSKPAFTLRYCNAPAMDARWAFVVDQSCVRACADDLNAFIREVTAR